MPTIRRGDVGTVFRWTVSEQNGAIDVSAATVKQVKFVKPSGEHIVVSLVNSTKSSDTKDGTDGRVEYVTVVGDLDQKGTYHWQLFFNLTSWSGNSQSGTFTVEDVLF